ncbi:TIGR02757 family protein [Rhizosphaericola mali]|uniref:TIGR02757 family protein n=1 Tax=Rhizosphaericola mali TaxID=2545455 RepID=UPI001CD9FF08|nr:TIGR02757 family protein [Rhizosphaericola mali]
MNKLIFEKLKSLLDDKVLEYNQKDFIPQDPISIPHQYSHPRDIEISGFFTALFAWGNRTIIINKSKDLMQLMGNQPYEFIKNHSQSDLKSILTFKHRTFNATDVLYMIDFLHRHYNQHQSLESAFFPEGITSVENGLTQFKHYFSASPYFPERTGKHIATPEKNSNCKRLNMFLRWMIRSDKQGVDFGIWKKLKPDQLIIPIDIHVHRVAMDLTLIHTTKINWNAALELTNTLKRFDVDDPVKYDFALFGMGINFKRESLI